MAVDAALQLSPAFTLGYCNLPGLNRHYGIGKNKRRETG